MDIICTYNFETMKAKITPFLNRYEEEISSRGIQRSVAVEDEVTFVGKIYKSILLDSSLTTGENPLTRTTKVRDETTDDE